MHNKRSFSQRDKRHPAPTTIDPICKMVVSPEGAAAMRSVGDKTIYFCSDLCAEKFDRQSQQEQIP